MQKRWHPYFNASFNALPAVNVAHDRFGVLVPLLQDAIAEAPGELPVELSPRVGIGQHSGALHTLLAGNQGISGKPLKNGHRIIFLQTAENKKIEPAGLIWCHRYLQ